MVPSNRLSDFGQDRVRIACERCQRAGAYRTDRLIALIGNVQMPSVAQMLAAHGGCERAKRPPHFNDPNYNSEKCQARVLHEQPPAKCPETLHDAMAAGKRLYLKCDRRREGLKSVRPCQGMVELRLRSLIAALGHKFEVDQLERALQCPGCGSRHYSLSWG